MADEIPETTAHARHAVRARWARTADRVAATEPGRRAFHARFVRQVDPDGVLDPAERDRQVAEAKRAYFRDLSAKSTAARRSRTVPDETVGQRQRDAVAAGAEAYLTELLDAAPPLSDEQLGRLRALLADRSGGAVA